MRIRQLEIFRKEIADFPPEAREDIFSLVARFINGERLNNRDFKTFKIDKLTKIQEFKVKDARGVAGHFNNREWRHPGVYLCLPQEITGALGEG